MFRSEVLFSSLQALKANRFRTFLTALGLVIGNASVILVVTISLASQGYILDQIQRIGSNLIYAEYDGGNNAATAAGNADYVKIADVNAVREQLGSRIVAATPVMNSFDRMRVAGREEDVAIIGSDQYYPLVRNLDCLAGRFLDQDDVVERRRVVMLMERLARKLFGNQSSAVGQTVKLHGLQFVVIGTFKEKTESFGLSELTGENVLIPITVLRYFSPIEIINPMYVQAKSAADVESITKVVQSILEARHRPGARYRVDNLTAILSAAKRISALLTVVLMLVSALALTISGIGIMNIMLVTVTERTREIGLRMAVGATRRNVLEQFLTEAVIISLSGGIVGILVGVAIPLSVRLFADDFAIPISPLSIVLAFTVSLIVGLLFGLLPANRAAKLNPTDALRYE